MFLCLISVSVGLALNMILKYNLSCPRSWILAVDLACVHCKENSRPQRAAFVFSRFVSCLRHSTRPLGKAAALLDLCFSLQGDNDSSNATIRYRGYENDLLLHWLFRTGSRFIGSIGFTPRA